MRIRRFASAVLFSAIIASAASAEVPPDYSAAAPAQGGRSFQFRSRACVVAQEAMPTIADKDDEIIWEKAPVLELAAFAGPTDIEHRTWAQAGCSKEGICVVFWCSEPRAIRKTGRLNRDEFPWISDCFELMLFPGDADTEKYYHIVVTPGCVEAPPDALPRTALAEEKTRGSLPYDSFGNDTAWNCKGLLAVTSPMEKGGWKGVIAVPFAAIGVDPASAPRLWRMNLVRYIPALGENAAEDLAWSVSPRGIPHDGRMFGYLVVPVCQGSLPRDFPAAAESGERRPNVQAPAGNPAGTGSQK
jgi:hypothetical protein